MRSIEKPKSYLNSGCCWLKQVYLVFFLFS